MKRFSVGSAVAVLSAFALILIIGCSGESRSADQTSDSSAVEKTTITARNAPHRSDRSRQTDPGRTSGSAAVRNSNTGDIRRASTDIVSVSGTVVLPDGRPAPDATVKLWTTFEDTQTSIVWHMQQKTETDVRGAFHLEAPRKEYWAVTADKENYAVTSRQEQRSQFNKNTPPIPAQMNLQLQPTVPFSGTVLGPDGAPLAGANVLAAPMDEASAAIAELSTFTDSNGRFNLKGLHAGSTQIAINAPGYSLEITEASVPDLNAQLKLSDKQPRLDGQVVSRDVDLANTTVTLTLDNGIQMPGLRMRWNRTADATGAFDFGPVVPGNISLKVAGNPGPLIPTIKAYKSGVPYVPLDLKDGQSTHVLVELTTGKILRGKVVDEASSAPLSGIRLFPDKPSMDQAQYFVETTATGEFILPHVHNISMVQIKSDFYYAENPWKESASLDEPVTIIMRRSPHIRGSVLAGVGGAVAGATLNMYSKGALYMEGTPVDIQPGGTFQIAARPGKYQFVAEARGYAQTVSDAVIVTENDIDGIKIVLGAGRQISGLVLTPDQKPQPGALVTATAPSFSIISGVSYSPTWGNSNLGPPLSSAISDATGHFDLSLLPANAELVVSALAAGYAHPAMAGIPKSPDPVSDLRLVLPATGSLKGTVVNEEGDPVRGAEISVYVKSDILRYMGTAVSSTTGSFVLLNAPRDSTATLSISKTGYQSFSRELMISDALVSVTLTKANTRTALVRCIDAATQKPVDAKLKIDALFDTNGMPAPLVLPIKDKPGEFMVSGVIVGQMYQVSGIAPDYSDDATYHTITDEEGQEIIQLMRLNGIISGRVVGADDHIPVPKATISLGYQSKPITTADGAGRFEISAGNSYGNYIAKAPDGRLSRVFSPVIANGGSVDVGDIEVAGKIPLTIRVIDGGTKKPMSDVIVNVRAEQSDSDNQTITGKTDRRGLFETSVFRPQGVRVELPDYNVTKNISEDRDSDAEWVVTCVVGSGVFRGRLLYNNEPVTGSVSGVHEEIAGLRVNSRTGSDGRFEFTNLTPGEWKFNGYAERKYASLTVQISADGDAVERDLLLTDGAVSGRVVNEAGQPVSEARVFFRAKDSGSGNTESDAQGAFSVEMPPGIYEIVAEKDSEGRSELTTVQVSETGESTPITLVLKAAPATITCTVLSILDGMPVQHPWAQLRSGEEELSQNASPSGSNGDLVIKNVQPGTYQLKISASGYSEVERTVTVESGQHLTFTDVLTPASSLNVVVTDSNGYWIKGAPVTVTPTDSGSMESARTAATDDVGSAKFTSLLYGTYNVSVTTPAGQTAAGMASTQNSKNRTFRLIVPAAK